MGHSTQLRTIVLVFATLGLASCMPERPKGVDIPREPMVILQAPGEKPQVRPQDPAFQSLCAGASSKRYLWVNEVSVEPNRIKAGRELNHRFVYTLCPRGVSSVTGTLTTRISQGGTVILTDPVPGYRLSIGQWAVDARITVPPDAPPGAYTLSMTFAGSGASFSGSADFTVY
jgi:hypothetical protein